MVKKCPLHAMKKLRDKLSWKGHKERVSRGEGRAHA